MITFLPSTDFNAVAKCLDNKRLGAQRYEAWSILKWLRNPDDYPKLVRAGYCLMWKGYEDCLVRYTNVMLVEWAARGFQNKELRPYDPGRRLDEPKPPPPMTTKKRKRRGSSCSVAEPNDSIALPPWLGDPALHSYHRHALVAKLPEHYAEFGWSEDGSHYNGSYPWPVPVECVDAGRLPPQFQSQSLLPHSGWVLRWPKSTGLPPVPVPVPVVEASTSTATKTTAMASNGQRPRPRAGGASSQRKRARTNDDGGETKDATPIRRARGLPRLRRSLRLRSDRRL